MIKQNKSALGKLILTPKHKDAAKIALSLIRSGFDVKVDNLEVLDEILTSLTNLEESSLIILSGEKEMEIDMVKRLRFDRGLDVRPRQND